MSNLLKGLLGTVLGVGKGAIGSAVRLGVGMLSGALLAKGINIDVTIYDALITGLTGLGTGIVVYIASLFNNKIVS